MSDEGKGHASRTITDLAKDWLRARQRVEDAKAEVNRAEVEEHNATNKLGKALAPADLGDEEQIGVWVGFADHDERLVMIRRKKSGMVDYEITLRGRKK